MSKVCQYATYNDKIFKGLMQVNVEDAQTTFKILLHGPRNLVKVGKNGRRFVLNVGFCLEKLRPLSKLNLHPKSSCLKRPWKSSKPSSLVMEGKRLLLYNKEFQRPKCGLLQRQNYFYLKPYDNMLCYE
jgi:hypothetical protein